jgi:hypothetical protein
VFITTLGPLQFGYHLVSKREEHHGLCFDISDINIGIYRRSSMHLKQSSPVNGRASILRPTAYHNVSR